MAICVGFYSASGYASGLPGGVWAPPWGPGRHQFINISPAPRPPQGGECFLRELRCKKEMAKNGGVPTRIRTGSKESGLISKKKWPFCWVFIDKSEKKWKKTRFAVQPPINLMFEIGLEELWAASNC